MNGTEQSVPFLFLSFLSFCMFGFTGQDTESHAVEKTEWGNAG
jgi:hypothetical protein